VKRRRDQQKEEDALGEGQRQAGAGEHFLQQLEVGLEHALDPVLSPRD
jgi:hypothetical protein